MTDWKRDSGDVWEPECRGRIQIRCVGNELVGLPVSDPQILQIDRGSGYSTDHDGGLKRLLREALLLQG